MKRTCYEWTGLSAALISTVFIGYWIASLLYDGSDIRLVIGESAEMKVADGLLTFCDNIANIEVISAIDNGARVVPQPRSSIGWNLTWMGFRYIDFGDGSPIWSLHTSLLIPSICLGVLSFLAFRGMRRINIASRAT